MHAVIFYLHHKVKLFMRLCDANSIIGSFEISRGKNVNIFSLSDIFNIYR